MNKTLLHALLAIILKGCNDTEPLVALSDTRKMLLDMMKQGKDNELDMDLYHIKLSLFNEKVILTLKSEDEEMVISIKEKNISIWKVGENDAEDTKALVSLEEINEHAEPREFVDLLNAFKAHLVAAITEISTFTVKDEILLAILEKVTLDIPHIDFGIIKDTCVTKAIAHRNDVYTFRVSLNKNANEKDALKVLASLRGYKEDIMEIISIGDVVMLRVSSSDESEIVLENICIKNGIINKT